MTVKTEQRDQQTSQETQQDDREPGSISGNLTSDPILRYTPNGRAVANIRVAVSDRVQDDNGQWVNTDAEFYTVTCWGQLAEHCTSSLGKGDRFVASGYWQENEWTDDNGEKHSEDVLVARDAGPSLLWHDATINRADRTSGKPRQAQQSQRRPRRK